MLKNLFDLGELNSSLCTIITQHPVYKVPNGIDSSNWKRWTPTREFLSWEEIGTHPNFSFSATIFLKSSSARSFVSALLRINQPKRKEELPHNFSRRSFQLVKGGKKPTKVTCFSLRVILFAWEFPEINKILIFHEAQNKTAIRFRHDFMIWYSCRKTWQDSQMWTL